MIYFEITTAFQFCFGAIGRVSFTKLGVKNNNIRHSRQEVIVAMCLFSGGSHNDKGKITIKTGFLARG
jgi:hypothetical protein